MRKLTLIALLVGFLVAIISKNSFAYSDHGYPYNTTSGCMNNCYHDDYNFCQNNCTSYVAYMLNKVYGILFSNGYRGEEWSHGGSWGNAAKSVGISVDKFPIPGDVAYWKYNWTGDPNNHGDDYGHVAWVEKVYYDSNGNPTGIDITEYNYDDRCDFGYRTAISINNPTGFIHILAFNEGVTSLYYLDCYETSCPGQTKEEWKQIAMRVWGKYRCKNCQSDYDVVYINSIAGGFGSGNPPDSEDSQSGDDYANLPGSVSGSGSGSSSKPDLYVQKLEFKDGKTKYYSDEDITIYAYAGNAGKDVSSSITKIAFKLYRFRGEKENDDTKEVGNENIKGENLESGDSKKEEFKFGAPDEENKYQFYGIIDANNTVAESNENNNRSGTIVCRVHKRPDIKVKELTLSGGRTQFEIWEIPKAVATFTNDGGEPFQDVPVRWYLDGNHLADDNMRHWNIEHGDEKQEDVNLVNLSLGTHTLQVCANLPEDEDQNNNCRELTFTVMDSAVEDIPIDNPPPDNPPIENPPDDDSDDVVNPDQSDGGQSTETEQSSSGNSGENSNTSSRSDNKSSSPSGGGGCFIGAIYN